MHRFVEKGPKTHTHTHLEIVSGGCEDNANDEEEI